MDLSIIIPAFNENKKIANDIQAVEKFLIENRISGEIIIVDDGSTDETSQTARKVTTSEVVVTKVIRNENHRGKGFAVRSGIVSSSGNYVMFADSGNCIPFEFALTGLQWLKDDICDIAHGSRKLPESRVAKPWVWYRKIYSIVFRRILILFLKIPQWLSDTQCGFKLYRGDVARQLFKECKSNGFMFDVEIILRAIQSGLRIKEFPIQWTSDADSRLSLLKNAFPILLELLSIKRMARRGFKQDGEGKSY